MLPEKGKLCFLITALLLLAQPFVLPAKAQEAPAVEIDTSVLDEYGGEISAPEIPDDGSYPRILSLQPLRSMIPSLTGPGKRLEKPFPAPKTTLDNMVAFPVQVKENGNKYAGKFGKIPPVPERKPPVGEALAENSHPAHRTIPIPPRRPAIQQASSTFVKTARESYASKEEIIMPAIPPLAVQEEALSPPPVFKIDAHNDPLGSALLVPDKNAMVKSVESVSKAIKKSPVLEKGQGESLSKIEPTSGVQETKSSEIIKGAENHIPRHPATTGKEEKEYISINLNPTFTEINEEIITALNKDIVPLMQKNPRWRVQIQAFAGGGANGSTEIDARRTSLSRALSVREHLLKNGIDSTRMDVRALGMQTDRTPADRVDFIFFDPETAK